MSKKIQAQAGMLNDEGQVVDIYVPRKCDYTNKILNSADKSSIQLNIGEVDEHGKYTGKNQTVILSGYLRSKGLSAGALEAVLRERRVLPF